MGRKTRPSDREIANLTRPKKGEVRNPTGKNNPDLQRLRKRMFTQFRLQNMISILLEADTETLKKVIKDKKEPEFNKWIANMILVGSKTADEKKFDSILNRTVGKVSEKLQVFGADEDPKDEDLSEEQKIAIAKDLFNKLNLTDDE